MQKFKLVRRKPTSCEWEIDQTTLDQWRSEKRLLPDDEIFDYSTQRNSLAKRLYPELAPKQKSNTALVVSLVLGGLFLLIILGGSIAALVGVNLLNSLDEAKVQSTKVQMINVEKALQAYKQDHGSYPTTEQSVLILVHGSSGPNGNPPKIYLKELPKDGWDRYLLYYSPSKSGREMELVSLGRDGEWGGEGYDADIKLSDLSSPQTPK